MTTSLREYKVYYVPEESPFKSKIDDLEFVFSSEVTMNRFEKLIDEELTGFNIRLQSQFKTKTDFKLLIIMLFYRRSEKRIFKVYKNGSEIKENFELLISLK